MNMYKNEKVGAIGIIITILILVSLVIITNINTSRFSKVENITNKLFVPIQNGITKIKNKISKNSSFFDNINNLKEENEELKEKNEKLEQQLKELEIIKSENTLLRQYSNMKDKYTEYTTVPAYIINKDITNFSGDIIINVGTENGITENMPVISSDGLVGHTVSVTKNTAKVQTIIDPASSISALMETTRDNVIIKGTLDKENTLKMTCIPTESLITIDDKIETSGLGGIYPKGILIGTVKQIKETKNATDRSATVETAVDFSKLETVLVITTNNKGEKNE